MDQNNLKRVFSDVVSVDSWHTPFDGATGVASVHIDAVFGDARIGGEADAPIRFRLKLKQAEIVVVVPNHEPLEVQRGTVIRDHPKSDLSVSKRIETTKTLGASADAGISGRLGPTVSLPTVSADLRADSSFARKSVEVVTSDHDLPLLSITQSQTSDGFYRWICSPTMGSALSGRPWNAENEPKLKIKDLRVNSSHIAGAIRVEVRCRREDLIIEDIVIKDDNLITRLSNAMQLKNKIIAVEAYLTHMLSENRLSFDNLSDPYGRLCLADVTVLESK